jgi:hypothetical protein
MTTLPAIAVRTVLTRRRVIDLCRVAASLCRG